MDGLQGPLHSPSLWFCHYFKYLFVHIQPRRVAGENRFTPGCKSPLQAQLVPREVAGCILFYEQRIHILTCSFKSLLQVTQDGRCDLPNSASARFRFTPKGLNAGFLHRDGWSTCICSRTSLVLSASSMPPSLCILPTVRPYKLRGARTSKCLLQSIMRIDATLIITTQQWHLTGCPQCLHRSIKSVSL